MATQWGWDAVPGGGCSKTAASLQAQERPPGGDGPIVPQTLTQAGCNAECYFKS